MDVTTPIEFSSTALDTLKKERQTHPLPLVRRRLQALWLKSRGLPNERITLVVGIGERTLQDYLQLYRQNSVDDLKTLHFCFG